MEKIFSSEPVLRTIIKSASDVVGGWFRGEELSDLRQAAADPAFSECSSKSRDAWCNRSVSGRARCSAGKSGLSSGGLSAILTNQRRMHPAIREIVSRAFYGGTSDRCGYGARQAKILVPSAPSIVTGCYRGLRARQQDGGLLSPQNFDCGVSIIPKKLKPCWTSFACLMPLKRWNCHQSRYCLPTASKSVAYVSSSMRSAPLAPP